MTTAKSPPQALRAQSHKIAETLKRAAAGEEIAHDPLGKLAASRARGYAEVGIAMDDKTIILTVPWAEVDRLTQPELCDFIFDQMSKEPNGRTH